MDNAIDALLRAANEELDRLNADNLKFTDQMNDKGRTLSAKSAQMREELDYARGEVKAAESLSDSDVKTALKASAEEHLSKTTSSIEKFTKEAMDEMKVLEDKVNSIRAEVRVAIGQVRLLEKAKNYQAAA
jgi:outer membrane murein-binding lipoprotein Lpp